MICSAKKKTSSDDGTWGVIIGRRRGRGNHLLINQSSLTIRVSGKGAADHRDGCVSSASNGLCLTEVGLSVDDKRHINRC